MLNVSSHCKNDNQILQIIGIMITFANENNYNYGKDKHYLA